MNGQLQKGENLRREDEWSSREFDRCRDVRSTKVRVFYDKCPMPAVSAG